MAYGQTSSGKTYTLFGDEQNKGIVPRFLDDIQAKLQEFESCEESTIRLRYSFFEIYKEKILDALDDIGGQNLSIRENMRHGVYVENLTVKETNNIEKIKEDLESANGRRRINETFMNGRSSRSHFVITFDIEINYLIEYEELQKDQGDIMDTEKNLLKNNFYEVTKKSKIIFIDLAGSERQTFNKSEVFEEGCYINKSLSILNHVITSLSKNKNQEFIHYRDSKLTFFLKDIFRGNSHFNIIGTVLPQNKYMNETLNTLNFVSLAKTVKTNPQINFETKNNAQMMQNQVRSLLMRIEQLESGDCEEFKVVIENLKAKLDKVVEVINKGDNKELHRISTDIHKFVDYTEENPITWKVVDNYKDKIEDLTFNVTETLTAIESGISTELKTLLKRFEKTLAGLSIAFKNLVNTEVREEQNNMSNTVTRSLLKTKTLDDYQINSKLSKMVKQNTESSSKNKPQFHVSEIKGQETPVDSNSKIDFGFTKYYKELKGKTESNDGSHKSNFNSFLKAIKASNSVVDSSEEKKPKVNTSVIPAKKSNFIKRNTSSNSSRQEIKKESQFDYYNVLNSPIRKSNTLKEQKLKSYKNYSHRDESLNFIREKALLDQERENLARVKEDIKAQALAIEKEKQEAFELKDNQINALMEELQKLQDKNNTTHKNITETNDDTLTQSKPTNSTETSKLTHLNKKIANLERQLRNRNKDYLFALKELEKLKLTGASNKLCSVDDMELI